MSKSPPVTIRRADDTDAQAIADIYNEAIRTTTATFDTELKSVEERTQWLHAHDDRHPVLVAVADDRVVGWAALSSWSDRCAYSDTAETSFREAVMVSRPTPEGALEWHLRPIDRSEAGDLLNSGDWWKVNEALLCLTLCSQDREYARKEARRFLMSDDPAMVEAALHAIGQIARIDGVFDMADIPRLREHYHGADTVLHCAAEECMSDIITFTSIRWTAFLPLDPITENCRMAN